MRDIVGVKMLLRTIAPTTETLERLKGKDKASTRALIIKGLAGLEVKKSQAGFYSMVKLIKLHVALDNSPSYEKWLRMSNFDGGGNNINE